MSNISELNGPTKYAYLPSKSPTDLSGAEIQNTVKPRFKLYGERVTFNEFEGIENNIEKLTPEEINNKSKWINKFFTNLAHYSKFLNHAAREGYCKEENKEKLDNAISISEGASQWGYLNKKFGGIGSKAVALSLLGSIGKTVLNLFKSENESLKLICNLWEGVLLQIRNFVMYFLVYGGDKDDKGKNVYEAKEFNDKPLKILAKGAYFSEAVLG